MSAESKEPARQEQTVTHQPAGAGKLTSSLPVVIQPALAPELSRPALVPGEIMRKLEEKKPINDHLTLH